VTAHTLSPSAQRVLDGARQEATRLGHDAIGAEHIVLSLLRDGDSAAKTFTALGLNPSAVRERLEAAGRRARGKASSDQLQYTSHAKRLIELATRGARSQGGPLAAEHLLAAAIEEPRGPLARLLADAGAPAPQARDPVPAGPDVIRGQTSARAPVDRPSKTIPARPKPARRRIPWRVLLLLAVPVSVGLSLAHAAPILVFATACLAVLPLASYMGESTEHLATRTGPTVGGLLNATFGNAAELIIAIAALRAGLVDLVKASITGSILGNLLLILGLSLLAAGLKRPEIRFNRTAAGMSSAMLALAVIGLVFPGLFHAAHPESAARVSELRMSESVALILIATYVCSLVFTMRTHKTLFGGDPHPMQTPSWSVGRALAVLGLATAGIAVESEMLVHATEAVTATLGLSQAFLGLVLIPIIGNAAEHAAAVMFARKGQVDLALQIALGSSTQIALLVAPLLVFVGLVVGVGMDLVFRPFEVIALGLATIVAAILTLDGESHWFEGVQLLAVYAMVAVAAFFI
jgi:Ca2+:H+ antiporter